MRQRFDDTMRSAVTWLRRALPVTCNYVTPATGAFLHVMAAPLDRLGGSAAARKSARRNLQELFSSFLLLQVDSPVAKKIKARRQWALRSPNGRIVVQAGDMRSLTDF